MNKDNDIYKKFMDVFCYTGYDKDWSGIPFPDTIVLPDPSHLCAILNTEGIAKRCQYDTGWKTYTYKGFKPSKKDYNLVYFHKHFFSSDFIKLILNEFFKSSKIQYDIRVIGQPDNDYWCVMFKIDNTYSIGVSNVKKEKLREENGKLLFTETELDDDLDDIDLETFAEEWVDGKAIHIEQMAYGEYRTVVWDQSNLFDEIEDEGDSLLI